MEQTSERHPLDVELFDFATGVADKAGSGDLIAHLEVCPVCRLRVARMRGSEPIDRKQSLGGLPVAQVTPSVSAALKAGEHPDVEAGQVWLAGGTRRVLIWVHKVLEGVVVAHPVSLDVGAADESSLIVDELPMIAQAGAVVTSVIGTVPTDEFVAFFGRLEIAEQVESIRHAAATGMSPPTALRTGPVLSDIADPRWELRQLLADDLASLDRIDDAPEFPAEITASAQIAQQLFGSLRRELAVRPSCRVQHVTDVRLIAFADALGWIPVARVRELDCVVLVVAGSARFEWLFEHGEEATRLLDLAEASVLALTDSVKPYGTSLFEVCDLRTTFELPRAVDKNGPVLRAEPRPIAKALFEYLDSSALPLDEALQWQAPVTQPEISPLLAGGASAAISEIRNTRAQSSKNIAFKGLTEQDAELVASALAEPQSVESLLAALDEGIDP